MSQIIHGPPKIWGPGQLPDLPPLKPALAIGYMYITRKAMMSHIVYRH